MNQTLMAKSKTKEVEIISTETIKPCSPTPSHLKTYKLSVLDQLISPIYIPMILVYTTGHQPSGVIVAQLKHSLSKTLSQYYPFAGRILDDSATIDCNDAGVDFVEAQIHHCQLSDVVEGTDPEALNQLFPSGFLWRDSCKNVSLLGIQVTLFDCGGVAVVTCISHKLADGCSISSFLNDWAYNTRHHQQLPPPPVFISALLDVLPLLDVSAPEIVLEQKKCATKRFAFDASKIAKLKAATTSATPVEIVTAFLYKCATDVAQSKKDTCVMLQMVNMRGRVVPSFSKNSIGNFCWFFCISTKNDALACEDGTNGISLDELVSDLRREKGKLLGDHNTSTTLELNDWLLSVVESTKQVKVLFDNIETSRVSSLTGKSFMFYGSDFGWGKPVLVRMADGVVTNSFVLFDSPDGGGIDAWVTLDERDMPLFQRRHDHHLSAI